MNKKTLLGATALRTFAAAGLAVAFTGTAFAQEAPADQPPATQETEQAGEVATTTSADGSEPSGSEIIVTGSRIARPNLDSPVPITSISATELLSQGNVSVGDALNELPQLRSTFSQSNSTRFIGTAGINAVDLRGLGTARTLVLIDGRRVVTATPGVNRPDINIIPADLLDRVDVVTGGNSAIYGSDAVAGVVNFVLKQDFEGLTLRGQGGISSRGDRGSYFVSATAGRNFFDGRANISGSVEYAKQNTLYFTDRDAQTGAYSGRSQFNLTQNTGPNLNPNYGPLRSGPEPSVGDEISDRTFLTGVRNNTISEGGLLTAACPVAPATGESTAAFNARRALACNGQFNPSSSNPLAQFGNTFVFQPDGSLIQNPCITDLRGPSGGNSSNCIGGLGSTLRLTGMLSPGLRRIAGNLLGQFEITPALVPFFRAQYVRVDANQEGQPTFFNNSFSINNPFLTDQARTTLQSILAPGATTFTAQRFNVDFGGRGEDHKRENYQIVGGIRGEFNDDWRYEVSGNYGYLYTYYETAGNLRRDRYANAINAVRNTAGQIVCGINADASTTNDDPACVPVNLFGNGAPSRAALDYFLYTSSRVQRANLYNASAYVAGDLSQLFELPGGPVAFVVGAEYRKETAFAAYDPLTSSTACGTVGCTFLNVIPDFVPPDLKVKEAFAEISIPILRDLPIAHELTLSGAGRVSDYNLGSTGTVVAWNISGIYAPVRDVRFRANLARSVRAPTQSDLYSPLTQTFLNGLADPCGQQNINNNPNRVRNCQAAGVPTTQTFNGITEPFTNRPASGIAGFNGANENLSEERGDSLTIGAVIQPRFVPGLSFSVDYYRIKLKDAIFSLAPQTIINQCYDSPTGIDNPFCAAIFRNPNGTFRGQQNVIHAGTTVSIDPTGASFISGPFNYARQETSGIDADLSYRRQITPDIRLSARAVVSYTIKRNNFTNIQDPTFAIRQLGVLGDPQWQGNLSTNLEYKGVNFGYRGRYIGKTTVAATYETQNSFQGRAPEDPDAFPFVWYPEQIQHDLRLDFNVTRGSRFYVGVDNVTNELPPYDLLGTEGGSPYDPVGRFFYAGVQIRF